MRDVRHAVPDTLPPTTIREICGTFCNIVWPAKDVFQMEKAGPFPFLFGSSRWLCRNCDFFQEVCTHPCSMAQHCSCNIYEVSMAKKKKGLGSQHRCAFKHIQIFGGRVALPHPDFNR